jgi:signal transduction histidine kinase
LIVRTQDGEACRDMNGRIKLACTCGLVLSGTTDPASPLFTQGGSFWVNDSALLLDIPPCEDLRLQPRNQCIHHGYSSFALVPIRNHKKIIGLIHFCDHSKECFTTISIEILEGIATHIGAALIRKQTEEENRTLQTQLIQAQKMEAIGTLAGGIAHDFNNILMAILGYAELIREDCLHGSVKPSDLDQVIHAGRRAKDLVAQILAFSRQTEVQKIPLLPALIIKKSSSLLRSSFPTTIDIHFDIEHQVDLILADPTQVHQILMNLSTNASQAMEQTGGSLKIILRDRELSRQDLCHQPDIPPGRFVELAIGDTGPGISPEIRNKIFDPYFTTKEAGKGTGMGLAIVHGIVTGYGGFITCESELGKGTTFRVFFPAIEKAIVTEVKSIDAAPPGTERILFVDDEDTLAELGKTMLERLGYKVTAQSNSLDALALFQKYPYDFDAVITD